MTTQQVPVNRTLVGALALVCLSAGGLMSGLIAHDASQLWAGAFIRVGVVLAAFWLALPTRSREAAWARVPIWKVAATLVGLLVIVRSRIPFQILIPVGVVVGVLWIILRPKPARHPPSRPGI